ncbi:hypothetical protein [Streptosporangium sp. NBC_01469]|uniref:hypothetical protein n=1 Tax=Streptosporangium sp. NBC_01469 TaxID=2903898 RepID=UPI002E2C3B9B|nr:hypothetical protein [Streptosporangium sp. NBC_01469]
MMVPNVPSDTSIATGIGAGFVTFVLIKGVKGKAREVHPLMWTVAGLFVVYFALGPIKVLLNLG